MYLGKEATLTNYIKVVFPLLLRNGVAHFLGYGNQHGFDPMSSDIQVIQLPNYLSCLAFNSNQIKTLSVVCIVSSLFIYSYYSS
ncbi:O-fucosyltransferase 8 [Glycine soja]